MRITCPNCGARYDVDEEVIPPEGRDAQCSNCRHVWFVEHGGRDAASPTRNSGLGKKLDPAVVNILREEAEREARARWGAAADITHDGGTPGSGAPATRFGASDNPRFGRGPDTGGNGGGDRPAAEGAPPARGHPGPGRSDAEVGDGAPSDDAAAARRTGGEVSGARQGGGGDGRPGRKLRDDEFAADPAPDEWTGFWVGFALAFLVAAAGLALYAMESEVIARVPEAEDRVTAYVGAVDDMRRSVDAWAAWARGAGDG